MESLGLRKRILNQGNDNKSSSSKEKRDESSLFKQESIAQQKKRPNTYFNGSKWNFLFVLSVLFHMGGILMFVSGLIFRNKFHNGQECEMTYSMRQFLEIDTNFHSDSNSAATKQYKLFKFVDRRDPRYKQLLKKRQPLYESSKWCMGNDNSQRSIVLYIPGHWGSYSQSRSIGAHGIQLTGGRSVEKRAIKALGSKEWSGYSEIEDSFVYDVYTVDFAEQGAALHGQYVLFQSDFVASAVRQLVNVCNVSSVTLVGHSMGGLVANLVGITNPDTAPFIRDIITLATPHATSLALDRSAHDIQNRLKEYQNNKTLLVSFSAGLKDEMVSPSKMHTEQQTSLSVLSPKVMKDGKFGMDHQAVVWCHQLLHKVRRTIWALSLAKDKDVTGRLEVVKQILGDDTYANDFQIMMDKFRNEYGVWKATCMQSAMLYNLPFIFYFFAIIGSMRCAFWEHSAMSYFTFISALVSGWKSVDLPLEVLTILCIVANAIHAVITYAMSFAFVKVQNWSFFLLKSVVSLGTALLAGLALVQHFLDLDIIQYPNQIFFLFAVGLVYLSIFIMVCSDEGSPLRPLKINFAALVSLNTPLMVTGPISLMIAENEPRESSWHLMLKILLPIVLFCVTSTTFPRDSMKRLSIWLNILMVPWVTINISKAILSRGEVFLLTDLMSCIAYTNIAIDIIQYLVSKYLQ